LSQLIATALCAAGIIALFYLDRDANSRTSKALWIPVMWLLINGSRPVSAWFHFGQATSQEQAYADGNPFDAMVYGILIAAGLLVLSLRSRRVGRLLRGNLPLLLFFAYCALSIAWSDIPFASLKRWIKATGDVVMILTVLTDPNPQVATKRVFARPAFVLLPLSVLFIRYYPSLGRNFSKSFGQMYTGVTMFKNELGTICLVFGLVSLWSFLGYYEDRKTPHRTQHMAAHAIVVAMAVFLCKTADSMTSLACFLLASAIMILCTRRWFARRPHSLHALVGGCIVVSLFALFLDESGVLVHALGRNASLTGRTAVWQAVLSMHTNPIVGTGFQSFWSGNRLEEAGRLVNSPGIQEAHNGYIELYLNLGWVGLALLATLMVTGYRNALSVFRRNPRAGRLRLAFFAAALIYSLTEAGFTGMNPIWIAFLLSVTFVPPGLRRKKRQPGSELALTQAVPPAETQVTALEIA
jgi:O-antigen ligase